MKVFISWSGGKDASLSFYKAVKEHNVDVLALMNMVSEDGTHSRTHGINAEFLRKQANAAGIPILQKKTTRKTYEEKFKNAVEELKEQGVEAGVFGDIDLQVHRDWIERVCRESGIQPIFPLWENNRYDIMQEFIQAGFKSIVVSVRHEKMDKSWLGREIDKTFISDLQKEEHIDLCGEEGEYHTFVYDGPIFQQAVDFSTGTTFSRDNHHFIEIKSIEGDLCSEGCTSCQR